MIVLRTIRFYGIVIRRSFPCLWVLTHAQDLFWAVICWSHAGRNIYMIHWMTGACTLWPRQYSDGITRSYTELSQILRTCCINFCKVSSQCYKTPWSEVEIWELIFGLIWSRWNYEWSFDTCTNITIGMIQIKLNNIPQHGEENYALSQISTWGFIRLIKGRL